MRYGTPHGSDYWSETQRQRLEDVGGSTAKGYGHCCDGESDVKNGVTPIKIKLLRKCQSSGSKYHVRNTEICSIVFYNERIYTSAFI